MNLEKYKDAVINKRLKICFKEWEFLVLLVLIFNSCNNTVSNNNHFNKKSSKEKTEKKVVQPNKQWMVRYKSKDGKLLDYWQKIKFYDHPVSLQLPYKLENIENNELHIDSSRHFALPKIKKYKLIYIDPFYESSSIYFDKSGIKSKSFTYPDSLMLKCGYRYRLPNKNQYHVFLAFEPIDGMISANQLIQYQFSVYGSIIFYDTITQFASIINVYGHKKGYDTEYQRSFSISENYDFKIKDFTSYIDWGDEDGKVIPDEQRKLIIQIANIFEIKILDNGIFRIIRPRRKIIVSNYRFVRTKWDTEKTKILPADTIYITPQGNQSKTKPK